MWHRRHLSEWTKNVHLIFSSIISAAIVFFKCHSSWKSTASSTTVSIHAFYFASPSIALRGTTNGKYVRHEYTRERHGNMFIMNVIVKWKIRKTLLSARRIAPYCDFYFAFYFAFYCAEICEILNFEFCSPSISPSHPYRFTIYPIMGLSRLPSRLALLSLYLLSCLPVCVQRRSHTACSHGEGRDRGRRVASCIQFHISAFIYS